VKLYLLTYFMTTLYLLAGCPAATPSTYVDSGENTTLASYSLTLYAGKYSDDTLGDILVNKPITFENAWLSVVALARIFPLQSPSHQWEIEGQLGHYYVEQTHWEMNIVAIYRWKRFPWNNYLNTTMALGDGLSYANRVPVLELNSPTNKGATRLLNYIVFETTFAPTWEKTWSLVTRVHHRSGIYGIFNGVEGGSNIVAVGVKFLF